MLAVVVAGIVAVARQPTQYTTLWTLCLLTYHTVPQNMILIQPHYSLQILYVSLRCHPAMVQSSLVRIRCRCTRNSQLPEEAH